MDGMGIGSSAACAVSLAARRLLPAAQWPFMPLVVHPATASPRATGGRASTHGQMRVEFVTTFFRYL